MSSARQDDPLVVFSPSGRRGRFPRGTTVLAAARSLGVDLDSVCGGRAICGRCQVRVVDGELAKHGNASRAGNVSAVGPTETRLRSRIGIGADRRIGCQAQVLADVAIDVPADSQVHRQVVRKPFEVHDIDINPVVRVFFVEVAKPGMQDPSGDLQRLLAALRTEWRLEGLSLALPVLRELQGILREEDRRVTVAVREDLEIIAVWAGFRDCVYG
ncbi:MAG: 2Fe-2S iron-sulfur cluster-binding protein, partial [Gammaproteobacteria bacterium]|nr:2Fe-2S iron-sulfur cluster-binding protein [Gammaproteobacteria bacterium]